MYDVAVVRESPSAVEGSKRWRAVAALAVWIVGALVLGLASMPGHAEAQPRRRRRASPVVATVPHPRARPTEIWLQGSLEGTEITIDGAVRDVLDASGTPQPIPVTPGEHAVRVRRPGYSIFNDVVDVPQGERVTVEVEVFPISHVVYIRSEPVAAHIYVDGVFRGETPASIELAEGEHDIEVRAPNHAPARRRVDGVAGVVEELAFTLVYDESAGREEWYESPLTWTIIGGTLAIGAGIAVTAFVLSGQSSASDSFCADNCLRFDIPF